MVSHNAFEKHYLIYIEVVLVQVMFKVMICSSLLVEVKVSLQAEISTYY